MLSGMPARAVIFSSCLTVRTGLSSPNLQVLENSLPLIEGSAQDSQPLETPDINKAETGEWEDIPDDALADNVFANALRDMTDHK